METDKIPRPLGLKKPLFDFKDPRVRNMMADCRFRYDGQFDPLWKMLAISKLDCVVLAEEDLILDLENKKAPEERIAPVRKRVDILKSAKAFVYAIYNEGETAINLNGHLNFLNLQVYSENQFLRAEIEKLTKLIEEWKSE